jgi:DNA mismatch repair protein MutL
MSDVIKLLPDSVANQIAAGEVIQRPASAAKELLENAIDAGASQIKLIVKDAGRTLIQVTDNGRGMSETDARMCFERHATSKINQASDLFSIRTMGFRGEALASIAAIARVEMKSRTEEAALGTEVIIEGSVTESQQPCQCPKGTSIAVKNLFFNTPARRNFLKSDTIEKGHIYNELVRVAMAYPEVGFMYYQNGQLTHQFEKSNLKQRIVNIFGNNYNQRLVPVEEKTEIVSINGFVLKPEFSKKKRGEQFFFVNNRYIRSSYLNHAVDQAFQELIPEDLFPSFFLFMETDPGQIDVNVHPTKTEIKFQDERYIYQILKSAVKRSLGRYNITPTLDFERETAFDDVTFRKDQPVNPPGITVNPDYNPFETGRPSSRPPGNLTSRINPSQWEKLFPGEEDMPSSGLQGQPQNTDSRQTTLSPDWEEPAAETGPKRPLHLHQRFILAPVKSGLMVIDHQRAHERILFEGFMKSFQNRKSASQHLLFPENISLSENDAELLKEMLEEIAALGFKLDAIGKNTFVLTAIPAEIPESENLQGLIEGILESFKMNKVEMKLDVFTNLARSLARRLSLKHGKPMTEEEMIALTDALFACEMPYQSPAGKPTLTILPLADLAEKFK